MRIYIHYSQTFRQIREYQKQFNDLAIDPQSGKADLKIQIRKQHIQLMEHIIRLYCKKINHQGTEIESLDSLPGIHLNNRILSEKIGSSKKTVYNLIERLIMAGMITKDWKGSKFSYEIQINPELLAWEIRQSKEAIASEYQADLRHETRQQIADHLAAAGTESAQSLLHNIDTGNSINKLSISKVDNCESTSQSSDKIDGSGNSLSRNTASKGTKNESKNSGPAARLKMDKKRINEILILIESLWNLIFTRLYAGRVSYLSVSQILTAKKFIASQMIRPGVDPDQVYDEFSARIFLVEKWLNRVNKPGGKARFVPLPSVYFDPENPTGFAKTAEWYQAIQENKARISELADQSREELRIYSQFRTAIGSKSADLKSLNWNQYQSAKSKIKALESDELLSAFHQLITN